MFSMHARSCPACGAALDVERPTICPSCSAALADAGEHDLACRCVRCARLRDAILGAARRGLDLWSDYRWTHASPTLAGGAL
jgi:predicted amidophosphoribosyltransferase